MVEWFMLTIEQENLIELFFECGGKHCEDQVKLDLLASIKKDPRTPEFAKIRNEIIRRLTKRLRERRS